MPFFSVQRCLFERLRPITLFASVLARARGSINERIARRDVECPANDTYGSPASGNGCRGRHGSGTTGKRELSVFVIACRARSRYARKESDVKIIHETRRSLPFSIIIENRIEKATFISSICSNRLMPLIRNLFHFSYYNLRACVNSFSLIALSISESDSIELLRLPLLLSSRQNASTSRIE